MQPLTFSTSTIPGDAATDGEDNGLQRSGIETLSPWYRGVRPGVELVALAPARGFEEGVRVGPPTRAFLWRAQFSRALVRALDSLALDFLQLRW